VCRKCGRRVSCARREVRGCGHSVRGGAQRAVRWQVRVNVRGEKREWQTHEVVPNRPARGARRRAVKRPAAASRDTTRTAAVRSSGRRVRVATDRSTRRSGACRQQAEAQWRVRCVVCGVLKVRNNHPDEPRQRNAIQA